MKIEDVGCRVLDERNLPADCAHIIYLTVDSRHRTQAMCAAINGERCKIAWEYEKSSQQSVRQLTGGGRWS